MTMNEQITKARKELNDIADSLRETLNSLSDELEEIANQLPSLPDSSTQEETLDSFATACALLRSGQKLPAGQIIYTELEDYTTAKWRVLESRVKLTDNEVSSRAVVQLAEIIDYRSFSTPTKEHPYGWNDLASSDLMRWINSDFLRRLDKRDQDCIVTRTDLGDNKSRTLWLLSDEEAGFGDPECAFEWYRCEEDELNLRRQLKDRDGDPATWWLRTPNAGHASGVRNVSTSGALHNNGANNAYGVAPACFIQ